MLSRACYSGALILAAMGLSACSVSAAVYSYKSTGLSVLPAESGLPNIAAVMQVCEYPQGATAAELSKRIPLTDTKVARSTPEGLECLNLSYEVAGNLEGMSSLVVPSQRQEVLSALASNRDPKDAPVIGMQLKHSAVFGGLTSLAYSQIFKKEHPKEGAPPVFEFGPIVSFMTNVEGEYAFLNWTPASVGEDVFNTLSSIEPTQFAVEQNAVISDQRYLRLLFLPSNTSGAPRVARDQDTSIAVYVATEHADAEVKGFSQHVISVFRDGSDDDISALFDSASKDAVELLVTTTNDRQQLRQYRQALRSGDIEDVNVIKGNGVDYLIWSVSRQAKGNTSAPSGTRAQPSTTEVATDRPVFLFRCARENGKLRLASNHFDSAFYAESLLCKNNTPSTLPEPSRFTLLLAERLRAKP